MSKDGRAAIIQSDPGSSGHGRFRTRRSLSMAARSMPALFWTARRDGAAACRRQAKHRSGLSDCDPSPLWKRSNLAKIGESRVIRRRVETC